MYNAIKKEKESQKPKREKILSIAILMFISFSLLNIFLIFNFMYLLSNI